MQPKIVVGLVVGALLLGALVLVLVATRPGTAPESNAVTVPAAQPRHQQEQQAEQMGREQPAPAPVAQTPQPARHIALDTEAWPPVRCVQRNGTVVHRQCNACQGNARLEAEAMENRRCSVHASLKGARVTFLPPDMDRALGHMTAMSLSEQRGDSPVAVVAETGVRVAPQGATTDKMKQLLEDVTAWRNWDVVLLGYDTVQKEGEDGGWEECKGVEASEAPPDSLVRIRSSTGAQWLYLVRPEYLASLRGALVHALQAAHDANESMDTPLVGDVWRREQVKVLRRVWYERQTRDRWYATRCRWFAGDVDL